ncbi:MAG TPA: hypothetical protein VH969_03220 [Actinophytocola sp.]|jgi:hypothetical protein|uniref:hypothetical protein n=1 Tax=Actinophytocola sp. TaxID=1872138 RepID=UPI002F92D442
MSIFVPADLAVGGTRALAQSALPDAPVEPEPRRRRGLLRILSRTASRTHPAGRRGVLRARPDPAGG